MAQEQRKGAEDKRSRFDVPPLYVRLSPREYRILEAALKLKFGKVVGNKSDFVRRAILKEAAQIIREAKRKRSEGE